MYELNHEWYVHSAVLGEIATSRGNVYTRAPDGGLLGITGTGYYLHDGFGSTAAIADDSGLVTNRYTYDPYGQTTITCPTKACLDNPYQYTGAHHDEGTGMYKIGHRYYQPEHGRWTQPDPLGGRINVGMPTETHAYLYVGCDPINNTDPTGTSCVAEVIGWVMGAVATFGPIAQAAITATAVTAGTVAWTVIGIFGLVISGIYLC